MSIVDVSNLPAPLLLASFNTAQAYDVSLVGPRAYVANGDRGLLILELGPQYDQGAPRVPALPLGGLLSLAALLPAAALLLRRRARPRLPAGHFPRGICQFT